MAGNDSNTKVLLHLDGTNGSTSFPDLNAGGSAHTWTATGAAAVSTAQSVFGGASLRPSTADGQTATNYISAASSANWNFGSGNFTIDFWVQINNGTTDRNTSGVALAWWDNGAGARGFRAAYYNGGFTFIWTTDGTTLKTATFTQAISASTFYHVAFVRNGSTLLCFVNGTSIANTGTSIGTDTIFNAATALVVGGGVGGAGWASLNGYIDEFRVSNIARWTSNFSYASAPYGVDYAVSATAGSYSLTGAITNLLKGFGYKLTLAAGSYALTGTAAVMRKAMRLSAAAGVYAMTGKTATITKAMHMTLAAGSYAVTGAAATMKKVMHIVASAGAYTLTFPLTIIDYFAGPQNAIRRAKFVLQKLRTTDPTLDQ